MNKKQSAAFEILKKEYAGLDCALHFRNNFELLIAVSLSAQTTDIAVNKVTPVLFKRYGSAEKLARAKSESVEKIISTIGMYRTKAKNIIALSKIISKKYHGKIPGDFDALVSLPGVGRKTANVVLSIGFGKQAIPVDTHVFRVSNRIGFASEKTPEKTEFALMKLLPECEWNNAHNSMIWHGRRICHARKPECDICPIEKYCKKNLIFA
jgi:endonuclease-3